MAYLVFEDGKVFPGTGFGADGVASGRLVFNTCMTGYQEIITDPANYGNIVTMTYTEIGNVGVNEEDAESGKPQVSGFVVRHLSPIRSNYRTEQSLEDYFKANGVVAIKDVDTRAVAKYLRDNGPMSAVIACGERLSVSDLVELARKAAAEAVGMGEHKCSDPNCTADHCGGEGCKCAENGTPGACHDHDCDCDHDDDSDDGCDCGCCCHGDMNLANFPCLVEKVTCQEAYQWTQPHGWIDQREVAARKKVVVVDLGVRRNQLRYLVSFGCDVTVVPATATSEDVLAMNPDGVFISNGPGAPWAGGIIESLVDGLVGQVPVFAVGLGAQMVGMSLGMNPCILDHGQHGANIPVQNVADKTVAIVAANIDYALDGEDFTEVQEENELLKDIVITHVNLNYPEIIEGFTHKTKPVLGVLWNPGVPTRAQDGRCLYDDFMDMMNK